MIKIGPIFVFRIKVKPIPNKISEIQSNSAHLTGRISLLNKAVNRIDNPAEDYTKNICKWKATIEFCNKKGYQFKVLTEKTINQL